MLQKHFAYTQRNMLYQVLTDQFFVGFGLRLASVDNDKNINGLFLKLTN